MMDISEGNTNNYLIPGVFGVIAAGIAFVFSLILGIVILLISIGLFAGTNGLDIDIKNQRYRKYGKIWFIKIGSWKPMIKASEAKLVLSSENSTIMANAGMMGYMPSTSVKVITYDVHLFGSGDEHQTVYEFLDYKNAKKALKALSESLDIPGTDKVAEKLAQNRNRRRRR